MVSEQNPYRTLVPDDNSWKFKRADLVVTRTNLQLQCYQNYELLKARSIQDFSKYLLGLSVENKGFPVIENSRKRNLYRVRKNPGGKH